MSDQIDIQLKNIQEKLQYLLKSYHSVQKENVQLKKELEDTKVIVEEKSAKLNELQQKVDVLKVGINSWSEEDKITLGKRIDTYLKDIDKCLSLLNME